MARIRAVLFDIDGTLLDSNDAHAHAWLDSLRGHGRELPYDHVRSKVGMGGDKLLAELAGIDHASVDGQAISERRIRLLKGHYLPDVGPFHGSRVLVDRLRSRGLTVAAMSSMSADHADDLLRAAGVADLMDLVVTADDGDPSKPDLDLVGAALDRIGVTAAEAILIGDTPYDIDAARRSGVAAIALRCGGGWTDAQLAGAIAIYDDPSDLSAKLDSSPLALDRQSDPPPPMSPRLRRVAMRGI